MLLMIDNYDSFTYNIVQMLREQNLEVRVKRNDETTLDEIASANPDQIVLSPGPGTPDRAGICLDIVRRFHGKIPILGICLGHQAIAAAYETPIVRAQRIVHGKVERVHHDGKGLFCGIPTPMRAVRYHSLAVQESELAPELEVTARSDDGEIMGIRHRRCRMAGIQFHPESIGSEHGARLLRNFILGATDPVPIPDFLGRLTSGESLTELEANSLMSDLMEGHMTPSQIGAFLMAMRIKGETLDEIVGFARAIRDRGLPFPSAEETVDTCGTGGDKSGTFNISTAAAIVAAGAGARVAKHGNRSVTSRCGSADLLHELGVSLEQEPADAARSLASAGIAFLYAPKFHGAMKHAALPRRELGMRTVFNLLGPLCNPAGATRQLLGVYDAGLTEIIAKALDRLGSRHAMVVHGEDGLDEISLTTKTRVTEVRDGWLRTYRIDPREFGFKLCGPDDLVGGDVAENRKILESILDGEKGPRRDVVLLNAAAVLVVAGIAGDLREGISKATESIDRERARECLSTLCTGSFPEVGDS